jgi:hypothetical protein
MDGIIGRHYVGTISLDKGDAFGASFKKFHCDVVTSIATSDDDGFFTAVFVAIWVRGGMEVSPLNLEVPGI